MKNLHYQQINVGGAWELGLTGAGAKILVIDTGYDTAGHVDIVDTIGDIAIRTHGTKVTNIIASIAPGASFFMANASNEQGLFEQEDLANAIIWGIENDVDVINMSLGGKGFVIPELLSAVSLAIDNGIELVAAMGNGGITALSSFPAYINGIHGVGSVDSDGDRSSFSQSGVTDIFAPGRDIDVISFNGLELINSGTSLSTPMVSAAMLLMIEVGKDPVDIFDYTLPVEGESSGVLNIGFAVHTGDNPLLHIPQSTWERSEDLTLSYLLPEQLDVFNVSVYVSTPMGDFDLDVFGNFALDDGGEHEVSFAGLNAGDELIGNLFGWDGIYDKIDLDNLTPGDYDFSVEIAGQVIDTVDFLIV